MEVAQVLDNNSGSAKRRKVGNGELRLHSLNPVRITGRDGDDVINASKNLADSDEMSSISGDLPASCCSVDVTVTEELKFADLEKTAETVRSNLARRESFPLKQIKTHILSPTSMAGKFKEKLGEKQRELIESRRTVPPEKTPPAAELEEFFAAAEKELQNRFKDKYNYDIVNDVPLKGRFEWIELKP